MLNSKKRFILFFICLVSVCNAAPHRWQEKSKRSLEQNMHRISPESLNRYAKWKYSQYGEDGIIEEIFNRLNITQGFFVEFGAADGIFVSNTRHLWEQGWKGVYIEPNRKDFLNLQKNYPVDSGVQTLDYFVSWEGNAGNGVLFDDIKARHFPSQEIDFLSIDVDGADYYILKSLKCRPKVICIENNLKWHPLYTKEVPANIALKNNQQPLAVLISAAKKMGYEPVCMTINLFLVRKDLYQPFKMVPNDTLTLWRDAFRVFHGKDKMVNLRKKQEHFFRLEGKELNHQHPITENF